MDPKTIVGTLGASIILLAFVLNQTHKISRDSTTYDLLNLIGSFLLVLYAVELKSFPFAALNGIWASVSLKDLLKNKLS